MSKRNNQSQKMSLAVAMAGGQSAPQWAKKNGIPPRTAYRWAGSAEVVEQVDRIRARVIDRAIGKLTRRAMGAAAEIGKLSGKAASESVRLQASRAVLAELLAITNFAAIERRLAMLEGRMKGGRSGGPRPASGR